MQGSSSYIIPQFPFARHISGPSSQFLTSSLRWKNFTNTLSSSLKSTRRVIYSTAAKKVFRRSDESKHICVALASPWTIPTYRRCQFTRVLAYHRGVVIAITFCGMKNLTSAPLRGLRSMELYNFQRLMEHTRKGPFFPVQDPAIGALQKACRLQIFQGGSFSVPWVVELYPSSPVVVTKTDCDYFLECFASMCYKEDGSLVVAIRVYTVFYIPITTTTCVARAPRGSPVTLGLRYCAR